MPRSEQGIRCRICINSCTLREGEVGWCGIRKAKGGKIKGGAKEGDLSWYYDSLPTNCVASWICAAGVGAGYPNYAYRNGPERGYKNLAVFYHGCTFDCLFCQNWSHRERVAQGGYITPKQLVQAIDDKTSCICYFGGDPASQILHSLSTSRIILKKIKRIFRICWETNGSTKLPLLMQMAEISLKSGGCIKFDLKAFTPSIHLVLTGLERSPVMDTLSTLIKIAKRRPEPPLLIVSTLLVPGYVDKEEIKGIASFLSSIDPNIPWSLLGFHPQFMMSDLPTTSLSQANQALTIAKSYGLQRINIGNLHLLS
jgi:pyruvate formate lyase activating enzyme